MRLTKFRCNLFLLFHKKTPTQTARCLLASLPCPGGRLFLDGGKRREYVLNFHYQIKRCLHKSLAPPWVRCRRFAAWAACASRLRGAGFAAAEPISAPETEVPPPPFSPCCDCYGAALGRGSGGRRAGAPRCVPAGGSGDSGTAPPGSPCRCHPAPLPPPQGEGAARKALNGGPGSAGAAGLIKHCICIALRYPPDWSCSERRIIYCGSRVLSAATAWRDGGGGRGVERPPQPLEEQLWQPALLGGAQIKDQEEKKKKKKKRPTFFCGNIGARRQAKYSGRTGSAHSPSPPLLPRCVSTANYHGGSRLGRTRPRPPGQAFCTPPV